MKRWQITVLCLVALLAVASGYTGYSHYASSRAQAAESHVQLADVRRGSLAATVSTTGSVVPNTQSKLSFSSGGRLKDLNVQVGTSVKQGQVLATLDTTDLEMSLAQAQSNVNVAKLKLEQLNTPAKPEELAAAQSTYDSAVAKLNQLQAGPSQDDITVAKAAMDKAQVALQQAQTAYDKVAWRSDIGSRPEAVTLQQATIDYNSAKAAYDKAIAPPSDDQIKAAQAAVHTAQNALDNLKGPADTDVALAEEQVKQAAAAYNVAQLNLDNAVLKAPFDGEVAAVGANPGEQVGAATAVVTLIDPTNLRVDATVDEMDVPKLVAGQPVQFTIDSLPGTQITGTVSAIAPSATIQQGVATFPVSLSIDPASASVLKGGMSVAANIIVQQKNDVLLVPNRAVHTQGRNHWVEVEGANGKTEQRQVQVGMTNDQSTEIVDGLQEGDRVVIPTTTTAQPNAQGGGFGVGGLGGGGGFRVGGR